MGYRKLSEVELAKRRQADRERLEWATRALLDSEGWRRWVTVRSTRERLPGTTIVVPVASAEVILQSKRMADRPKDRAVLERMREALDSP